VKEQMQQEFCIFSSLGFQTEQWKTKDFDPDLT
jgi:hypothetical protein